MKKLTALLFLIGLSVSTFAQESGLQLLNIAPSASELGRAEASSATPHGSGSVYSNPALLAMSRTSSINLTYTNWISDSNNLFGGINLRKNNRAVAFSIYTSGVTGFEQRDAPGESNGDFSIGYLSLSGAYAYNFKYFAAGVSAQYLNEQIYPYRANGYSFNLGLASAFADDKIRVGASLLNLGEMEELNEVATTLPTNFTVGVAADLIEFSHNKNRDMPILVSLMTDFVLPFEDTNPSRYTDYNPHEAYFNLGTAITIAETVEVSAGYKTGDNTRPLSFGLGILTTKGSFYYALVPFNTGFGTVHSVGIQYRL